MRDVTRVDQGNKLGQSKERSVSDPVELPCYIPSQSTNY